MALCIPLCFYALSNSYAVCPEDDDVPCRGIEKKLLNLYFSRESGEHLLKNLNPLFQETMLALKLGFNNARFEESLPVIAQDEQLTHYEQPVAHSWHEDIYAQGSYSNFGIPLKDQFSKTITYKEIKVKSLFEPIEDQIFLLASIQPFWKESGQWKRRLNVVSGLQSCFKKNKGAL